MISSYTVFGIAFSFFWGIYYLCNKKGQPDYTKQEIAAAYIFTRIVPVCMLTDKSVQIWLLLLFEWIILALLGYYVYHNKTAIVQRRTIMFYIFCPAAPLFILAGSSIGMCLSVIGILCLCMADCFVTSKGGSLMAFVPEYFLGNIGILGWIVSIEVMGQTWKDVTATENIPMLYITSAVVAILASGMAFYRIAKEIFYKETRVPNDRGNHIKRQKELKKIRAGRKDSIEKERRLTIKDIGIMSGLTLIFAILVLFRLGSHRVPETYQDIQVGQTGENQIVLNFDKKVTLSKVYIYLGYDSKRSISFSSCDEQGTQWDVFDANHIVESAFAWNEIDINNRELVSLGMVLMEGNARIHEIVCIDSNGQEVLPSNANSYPNLFDEQGLFPKKATYYDQSMFDEVYHARTAYEFLHHLPIYENTHPPFGKTLISLGINLFGMNPFGWRIVCAVAGILMVPTMYLFAFFMFRKTSAASFATILLCTGFMNFTLARIATLDILVAFFVILMFAFMFGFIKALEKRKNLKQQFFWLFLCGLSTAAAIATKWTGIYAAVGIAVIYFVYVYQYIGGYRGIKRQRNYLVKLAIGSILFFIVMPLTVYTLSYLPFTKVYTDKGLIQTAIDNGKLMLRYHSVTVFDHPYSSEWYEWLWDKRPLLDSYTTLKEGKISVVATFINPLLCWGGFAAFFYQFYLWKTKQSKNACYLIFAYGSVMLPWLFIHRTVFIYQYFLGMLILILMIANSFYYCEKGKKYGVVMGVASILLFILFYPVLSGISVNLHFVRQWLQWLPTWTLAF